MTLAELQPVVDAAWDDRDTISTTTTGEVRDAVEATLNALDSGELRVAEKGSDGWVVNQWAKKAVLLSFRLNDMEMISGGPGSNSHWWDKVPSKFEGWDDAQIGKNVHLSGGVGIGGVLEPLQADPVIIEDNCFIGARSEVVEGVIVEEGSVLSMGVFISASTKIIDRNTGEVHIGRVPAYSVVVPGSLPGKPLPNGSTGPSLYCAVIVKTVDAQTRSKTSINDLLRD